MHYIATISLTRTRYFGIFLRAEDHTPARYFQFMMPIADMIILAFYLRSAVRQHARRKVCTQTNFVTVIDLLTKYYGADAIDAF